MNITFKFLAKSSLLLAIFSGAATPLSAEDINKTLKMEGVTFQVKATDEGSLNKLTVTPKGLSKENRPVSRNIEGTVTGVEVADLNGNGSPEIYLFVSGVGSGSYSSVIAFATNQNKSMTQIHFPEVDPKNRIYRGYMGHDRFRIEGHYLIRRFPLYKKNDPNCCPSGGYREVYYRLVPGEAMWQLKAVKSVDEK